MAEQMLVLMADLDREAQTRLSGWYEALRQAGFTGVQTAGLPYHISLATFPTEQEERAVAITRRASAEFSPVPVHLSHIGLFAGGKVLFAAPERTRALDQLQEACKSDVPGQYPWTPHATILIDEPEIVQAALPVLIESFEPFVAKITGLHLCAFWPTREIMTCELTGDK